MVETWKTIPNHENYAISDLGNVMNIRKNKILKPIDMGYGYYKVQLSDRKFHSIHRIVMSTFIGDNALDVNHINGIRSDNRLENLEYVTKKENTELALKGKKGTRGKKIQVYQIDMIGNIVKVWKSIRSASESLGIPHQSISMCCRGINKTCSGYSWRL